MRSCWNSLKPYTTAQAWHYPPDSGVYSGLLEVLHVTSDNVVETCQTIYAFYQKEPELIGWPTGDINDAIMVPNLRIGMASDSEHKDGVWAFMKFLLGDVFQNRAGGIRMRRDIAEPIIRAEIEFAADTTTKYRIHLYDENGNSVACSVPLKPLPEGTEQKLWNYIDSIAGINEYDDTVFEIVMEEANKFYDDRISAQAAAENIQSRVEVYLAEQYS